MRKKYVIIALAALLVIFAVFFAVKNKDIESNNESKIILYYGETCPHCKIVEAFLKENKISEKITFDQKEVFQNNANAQDLSKKASSCKINKTEIGVPFLWDGEKCFVGDENIINFFKEKAGLN